MRLKKHGCCLSYLLLHTLVLSAMLWSLGGVSSAALAQVVPSTAAKAAPMELPENLTREQVRDLVARLSDDQVRDLIITQLDKQAIEQEQGGDPMVYVGQLREGLQVAWVTLTRIFTMGEKVQALPGSIWRQITDNGRISGWYLLFQLIGLLVSGWIVERLAKRLLEKKLSKPLEEPSLGKKFDLACFGAALGMVELGAFAAGAFLFVAITSQQAPAAQMLWQELIWCAVLIKLVLLAVRQVAAPGKAGARLVSVSDNVANQAWAWALILSSVLILPGPLVEIASDFGADTDTDLLLRVIFTGTFFILLVALVIRLRHYGAALIAGEDSGTGSIRQTLAGIWWMLTIVYLSLIWLMSIGKIAATGESALVPGIGSLLLFVMIPYLDTGLKWLITRYFEEKPEETGPADAGDDAEPAVADTTTAVADEQGAELEETASEIKPGYIATTLRYARVLMVLALLMIFTRLWNIDIVALAGQLFGGRFARALFDISLTILLAWALWGVIRISIERKLVSEKGPEGESEEAEAGGLGGTRVETILPLIRIFIKITLIVMTVMVCLSALGVNIGPLIAGAGVVGIAIGFGAQTLVRDIVSGFFYLLDDAFRIGEYVVIDQIRGTVEKISVRSFQLRHHNGPVHTIPYGEIRSLTNWSRDWAIMKFELRIPFETDIDMVRKIIKQIGIDMMEDPVFGPLMLMPLKSQGVNRMDDSALIIRCKFTAIPGQQYLIRREAFTRIQRVFEEKGIQFAPRRVLVEATTPQEAVKAAAGVLDQEVEGGSAPKDNQSDQ